MNLKYLAKTDQNKGYKLQTSIYSDHNINEIAK